MFNSSSQVFNDIVSTPLRSHSHTHAPKSYIRELREYNLWHINEQQFQILIIELEHNEKQGRGSCFYSGGNRINFREKLDFLHSLTIDKLPGPDNEDWSIRLKFLGEAARIINMNRQKDRFEYFPPEIIQMEEDRSPLPPNVVANERIFKEQRELSREIIDFIFNEYSYYYLEKEIKKRVISGAKDVFQPECIKRVIYLDSFDINRVTLNFILNKVRDKSLFDEEIGGIVHNGMNRYKTYYKDPDTGYYYEQSIIENKQLIPEFWGEEIIQEIHRFYNSYGRSHSFDVYEKLSEELSQYYIIRIPDL